MDAIFADTSTARIHRTDPKLTDKEQIDLDRMVEADIEFWKEQKDGRSEEVVQGVGGNSD